MEDIPEVAPLSVRGLVGRVVVVESSESEGDIGDGLGSDIGCGCETDVSFDSVFVGWVLRDLTFFSRVLPATGPAPRDLESDPNQELGLEGDLDNDAVLVESDERAGNGMDVDSLLVGLTGNGALCWGEESGTGGEGEDSISVGGRDCGSRFSAGALS